MARLDQSDVRSGLAGDVDDPGRGAQDEGAGDDGDHAEPQVVGSDTRPLANPAPRQHARHAPPGQVGRFAILQRLGAGGMGVVYSAYDETLDRKVAVKVLRADARGGTKARDRLLREAQVMARLSHPNLVTVHEIGRHEGQVFIAMEFVRGQSLDQWITREPPRAWREVLAVFRQAGEALMAVHSAGLLHRDFKPHNAILGDDGVVKVLDFGLARALDARDSEVEDSSEAPSGSSGGMLAASLTRTGAILGTPAYMAPEQQSGRAATTRTDQFNFCASLYEALFGQLPFPTSSREVLVDAVMNGRVREPPASVHVPKWVRRVVARGLSAEPEARHPSMEALLRALDRDPAIRWRRRLGAAAIAGLSVLGGYGLFALGTERVGDCEGIERELAGVWSDARRDSVKAGLLASGSANAAETWERVERELDAYADAWSRLRAEGCEAHRDGRDAETIYARSVACLASRRASLSALVEVLESADDGVVENAVAAAAQLPELARCGDAAALLAAVSPPEDPDAAAIERAQRERLARAAVLESAGRYDEALGLAVTARAAAEDIEFPPLTAAAELRRGSVSIFLRDAAAAEEALSNALWLGLRYGDDRVANEAVARRIFVRTELLGDSGAGLVDEPLARALAFRVDADWRLRWIIDNNLGVAYERSGAWERAESLYRAALDQAMRRGSAGALEAIAASINVAGLVEEQGGYLEAIAVLRRTAGFVERWLGDHHPMMTGVRIPLARNLQRSGRHREAAEVLDACEEARRAVPNPLVGFRMGRAGRPRARPPSVR
ncbi:MAG: serine/threonine-protein kinase [Nannocystaceae bacterium]